VTRCLFTQEIFVADEPEISSFEAFSQVVDNLTALGLLSLGGNTLDWGDFKRRFPLCRLFGFSRGTLIDRYYLSKFISEIRPQVAGTVLEIGGTQRNREIYQFDRATEYQTIDIVPAPGVTYVGDVHDLTVIKPETTKALNSDCVSRPKRFLKGLLFVHLADCIQSARMPITIGL
jgi:hypothetical protein